ncbi:hypothetical protein [Streptomyces sp. NPDC058583]|uniref:hypothetical protein n=1 Tax=unclassified Streptomyces TaxID=2593676 RepID=UPI00365BDB1F
MRRPSAGGADARPRRLAPAPLGLETDEAYEIGIHPHVVRDYSGHHAVPPKTAVVVQLRSLLEDLIALRCAHQDTRTDNRRAVRLSSPVTCR